MDPLLMSFGDAVRVFVPAYDSSRIDGSAPKAGRQRAQTFWTGLRVRFPFSHCCREGAAGELGHFFSLRLTYFHDIFRAADKHPGSLTFLATRERHSGVHSQHVAGLPVWIQVPLDRHARIVGCIVYPRQIGRLVLNLPSSEELAIFGFCQRNLRDEQVVRGSEGRGGVRGSRRSLPDKTRQQQHNTPPPRGG